MTSEREFKKFVPEIVPFPNGSNYHLLVLQDITEKRRLHLMQDVYNSPVIFNTREKSFVLNIQKREIYLSHEESKYGKETPEFSVDRIEFILDNGFFPKESSVFNLERIYLNRKGELKNTSAKEKNSENKWFDLNFRVIPEQYQGYLNNNYLGKIIWDSIEKFNREMNHKKDDRRDRLFTNQIANIILHTVFLDYANYLGKTMNQK